MHKLPAYARVKSKKSGCLFLLYKFIIIFFSERECKRPAKTQPDLEANLTDRADLPDEHLDVPAAAAPAVPAGRLENPPAAATTTTTGGRNDRSSTVTAESRTDRVPKSLDFFDSTDELVAPPLKFETAAAFAAPQPRSSQTVAAAAAAPAPRQQIVFEQVLPPVEGRSLLIGGGGGSQNNKPVKFIEIFGEEDAITAP
jgi:hypothetical protein